MEYILVILLGVLATAKMSFQSGFSKNNVKTSTDALAFNGFVFAFSAALFLPQIFGCSNEVWLYAAVGAAFTVIFQLLYTKALSMGNVSLTVLIVNFSMVLNVLFSYFVYNDPISPPRVCGILLTVASFVICTRFDGGKSGGTKWLLFTVLAMFSTSGGSIVQKMLGESQYSGESRAFISCLYIIALGLTITIYPFLKRNEPKTFKIGFNMIKFAAGVGISLAVFQAVYTYALANVDGTFLFPSYTGITIVLSTLSGVLIFKDKLTRRQILGMAVGIVSIVLMNF